MNREELGRAVHEGGIDLLAATIDAMLPEPTPRFSLSPEATVHCEWHTFAAGAERCEARSTQVILDAEDQDDHQYPAGFHFAHLCDKHAQPALAFALAHPDEP